MTTTAAATSTTATTTTATAMIVASIAKSTTTATITAVHDNSNNKIHFYCHFGSKVAVAKGQSIDVADVMDTWTLQMGFPVVNVTDLGNGKARISQDRFLQDPQANTSDTIYTSDFG